MRSFLYLTVLVIFMAPVQVLAKVPLESSMTAFVVKQDKKGKEVFKPVRQAAPGDILEYRLRYKNTGQDPLYNLIIRGPVPYNTVYIDTSAKADIEAKLDISLDSGKTWSEEPVYKTIKDEKGQSRRVVAGPEDYTLLRWEAKAPLTPKAVMQFVYRVKVK